MDFPLCKCLYRCCKWDFSKKKKKNPKVADSRQLCICVLTGECAVFQMNGEAGLNDFQISWNRWKGHSWTTWHSSIKATLKWSSLPLTVNPGNSRFTNSLDLQRLKKEFLKKVFWCKKWSFSGFFFGRVVCVCLGNKNQLCIGILKINMI